VLVTLYQDKTRQYRAAQRQREENELTQKKEQQRQKVKFALCSTLLCIDLV